METTVQATKQNFAKKVSDISVKAFGFIESKLKEKPEYIFATEEQIENDEVDIYELPDFEFFSKHGFGEWVIITGIKENMVTGIGKETNNNVECYLDELSNTAICYLADYLDTL